MHLHENVHLQKRMKISRRTRGLDVFNEKNEEELLKRQSYDTVIERLIVLRR